MALKTPEQIADEHDPHCEAEFILEAGGYTDCGCADRAQRQLEAEVEETIADNAKIEAAFQNARDIVGGLIVPDEHDPRL